jgi:two-component system, OmpR family, response regulator
VLRPHVIVLEDDAELGDLVRRGLREEGITVTLVTRSDALMRCLDQKQVADVLVVDIGLPDADGRDVVQALRARGIEVPVIFLTARDALPDRLSAFAAGGDDYLTKPFAFAELVARVGALVKRGAQSRSIESHGLRVDPSTHMASCHEASVDLTPTEFRLLARLAYAAGTTVMRRELVAVGWPHGAIVRDNTLDVYIGRLRRKLAGLPDAPTIATVHGVGYAMR